MDADDYGDHRIAVITSDWTCRFLLPKQVFHQQHCMSFRSYIRIASAMVLW